MHFQIKKGTVCKDMCNTAQTPFVSSYQHDEIKNSKNMCSVAHMPLMSCNQLDEIKNSKHV